MIDRAERLKDFLTDYENKPVVWGESDCCTYPSRWAQIESGKTICLPEYRTREDAQVLIKKHGGLVNLATSVLTTSGFQQNYGGPSFGDIGIIRLSDRDVGAIFVHGGLALWRREDRGHVFIQPCNILISWQV